MATTITRDELQAHLDRGDDLIILEALPAEYYRKAHLPGAVNLPHDRVDELAPSLLPDHSQRIVVYCSNAACPNSAVAADRLTELGYTDVRRYEEGKQDWIDAGLPVERVAVAIAG